MNPARLTNHGDLALCFIGCGSAFAKTLNQNNVLVVKGEDHLLIDCGTRCVRALHDCGVAIAQISNYLITHSHADHIGGLEEVQLFWRYVLKQKPAMVITGEYERILWEQSLRGGSELAETGPLTFGDFWEVNRPRRLQGYPRDTFAANVGGINLKLPRTMHFPDDAPSWRECAWSCAVILDDRVLFTSDTRFDPELLTTYDERFHFEMIFHDCQLFTGGVHASLDELSTLPMALKRKMVLMHYGDDWRSFRGRAAAAGFHSWAKQGHSYTFGSP